MDSSAIWIIIVASLVAINAAMLGCFLIHRQMSMFADAISHAVLPGIVIAYFISGSRASFPMLIGAAMAGLAATWLIETLSKKMKMQTDASLGLSFTLLFAIGVILISSLGKNIDLDQDCVLYGEIALVPLDRLYIGSFDMGPRQFYQLGATFVILIIPVWLFFNRLTITTFDPAYATSIGISTAFWHYAIMGGVSLTTVVSFEAVGAILVVGFFAGLPAAAFLLAQSLKQMIVIASLLGIVAAMLGYLTAVWLNGSIAGAICVVVGLEFFSILAYTRLKNRQKSVSIPR